MFSFMAEVGGGGGGVALRGPISTKYPLQNSFVPILVKDTFQRRRCQKWSKISKTFSFNKRHEAHQIDQLNALNMKMHVVGGQKCFFNLQESTVVKTGQNWSAEFRSCHFVIGGRPGVGGRGPHHPLYPFLL